MPKHVKECPLTLALSPGDSLFELNAKGGGEGTKPNDFWFVAPDM